MVDTSKPLFWRDPRMPHVELRKVEDGRRVCYAPHSHTHWSMGAITGGVSTFRYRDDSYRVAEGTLVLMNPQWVHACNPIDDTPWSYLMLYVDSAWLARLRHEARLLAAPRWEDIPVATNSDARWYSGYCELAAVLLDPDRDLLDKQSLLVEYLSGFMAAIAGLAPEPVAPPPAALREVAAYLDANATETVSLDTLCQRSGYSAGRLIRGFKQHFGLTPHAYLVNRRIQHGQRALKAGKPIAEAALDAGFSDQPHFQRTFKRLLAATPAQYRDT